MKRIILIAALAVLAVGCSQDPFPKDGRIQVEAPKPVIPPPPVYVLDAPAVMEFFEGKAGEYEIKGTVPAPGTPVITINNLPAGAVYDATTHKLTWTPPADAANDANNVDVTSRSYPIEVILGSSTDKLTSTRRGLALLVKDVPRKFDITFSGQARVLEGETLRYPLKMVNEDFENGPFAVQVKNLPYGASIESDRRDPKTFYLTYTPDFFQTNYNDTYDSPTGGRVHTVQLDVTAVGPRSQHTTRQLLLAVVDVRQNPQVTAPNEVEQGGEGSFLIDAADLNGETNPEVTMTQKPAFGKFNLKVYYPGNKAERAAPPRAPRPGVTPQARAPKLPIANMVVSWSQIPADKMGTSDTVTIKTCVYGKSYRKDLCVENVVKITFTGEVHASPKITRDQWSLGTIRYAKVGETIKVRLPIADGDLSSNPLKVTVDPSSDPAEISWERGVLTIVPATEGFRQFNITATSAFGMNRSESFLLQVLPADWSSVLVLGKSVDSAEVVKTAALLDKPSIGIPAFLDEKILALRQWLVLGSEAVGQAPTLAAVETVAAVVPNLVVATPLLESLQGKLGDELKALNVEFSKRQNAAVLADATIEPAAGSGLAKPKHPIKLAGKLTPESASPLLLKAAGSTKCKVVLELSFNGFGGPIVQLCNRGGSKGVILVSGFEFGDLVTDPEDAGIAKQWMDSLTGKGNK